MQENHESAVGASAVPEMVNEVLSPLVFTSTPASRAAADAYLLDPCVRKLVEFFEAKGLRALKDEDRHEQWYDDWVAYQAEHRLYATLLSPKQHSTSGSQLDLLRLTRFIEVFAYFSPSHAYSLQVTFLGLFSILMGASTALKQEAVAALEAGGLLAFGVSEQSHGSDLLGNEFTVKETSPGRFVANGKKYYIGNANAAAIVSILARKVNSSGDARDKRAPLALIAVRPATSPAYQNVRKIHTLGVRAGFVGEFEVKGHALAQTDLIAEGRQAWDAMFGTVTLGKFFLGFGSIGICQHALAEAVDHLARRMLFGKPAIRMPHLGAAMAQAYARLVAMKLYAYRALDYVHAAGPADRRYLLFTAVQKAKVSTEGVKVMALLSECAGARGFDSETFLETALRDAQLIPAVEGSTHINLGLTVQFIPRYFARPDAGLTDPKSLVAGEDTSRENPYLMEARTGMLGSIGFRHFLDSYQGLMSIPNVRLFAKQAGAFRLFVWAIRSRRAALAETEIPLALGQCLATIAYGQLIAENSVRLNIPQAMVSIIFHLLVGDLTESALKLAASPRLGAVDRLLLRRMVGIPSASGAEWDFVAGRVHGLTVV
jgi:acyl-CoA dehydrogenase